MSQYDYRMGTFAYAHRMNSKGDWAEMDKLQIGPKLAQ